jgi:hypothetical protein
MALKYNIATLPALVAGVDEQVGLAELKSYMHQPRHSATVLPTAFVRACTLYTICMQSAECSITSQLLEPHCPL